jgi:PKD repeat protein
VNGSVTVTVIKPEADFVALSTTFFEDLPVTFQNLSTGAVSYQWELGDGSTSTMVHPSNTYFTPDTFYVTLIATNASGCVDSIGYTFQTPLRQMKVVTTIRFGSVLSTSKK